MTKRTSVRAAAREIYMTAPVARPQRKQTRLTARVRALYETSAVPVREIAALAGVTERTIYKYAAKQRWKKRYGKRADVAPVRGAGARFINRANRGKSGRRGLKATDPGGAKRAAAGCRTAEGVSSIAQAQAAQARLLELRADAAHQVRLCVDQLRLHHAARDKKAAPSRAQLLSERALTLAVETALAGWQKLLAEDARLNAAQSEHHRPALAAAHR
jgi:hypothetical protein